MRWWTRVGLGCACWAMGAVGQEPARKELSCWERHVVEEWIPAYEAAVDKTDKMRAAKELSQAKRWDEAKSHYTDAERKKIFDAAAWFDQFGVAARELETNMDKRHVDFITKDQQGAAAFKAGKAFVVTEEACDKEAWHNLMATVSLVEYATYGDEAAEWLAIEEKSRKAEYASRYAEWLRKNKESEDLAAFYELRAEELEAATNDEDAETRKKKLEAVLIENRVAPAEVVRTIEKFAIASPACFLTSERTREDQWRRARNAVLMPYFLDRLRERIAAGEKPVDSDDFATPKFDPVVRRAADAWGQRFRIRYEGKRAVMYSFGPDEKANTEDDIIAGTVPVP